MRVIGLGLGLKEGAALKEEVSEKEKLRAGVIGLGRIGWWLEAHDPLREKPCTHVGAYLEHPETQLVAVCDIDADKASDFARWKETSKYRDVPISFYFDFMEMVKKENLDIVSVATPDDSHAPIVIWIAPFVQAIFCEKSIAETVEEADKMIAICEEFNTILAVNQTRRWDTLYREVKLHIEADGKYCGGELLHFIGTFSSGKVREGVHMADLALWYGAKDITLKNVQTPYLVFEVDLIGSNERIKITDNGNRVEVYRPLKNARYSGISELFPVPTHYLKGLKYSFSEAMMNAVSDLVDCVRTGESPECTGEDGRRALELTLKVI